MKTLPENPSTAMYGPAHTMIVNVSSPFGRAILVRLSLHAVFEIPVTNTSATLAGEIVGGELSSPDERVGRDYISPMVATRGAY